MISSKKGFIPTNRNKSKMCCRSAGWHIYGATVLLRPRALVCVCLRTLRLESAAVCGSISNSSIHITIYFPSEVLCGLGT